MEKYKVRDTLEGAMNLLSWYLNRGYLGRVEPKGARFRVYYW